jgi:hypothetical protein
MIHGGPHWRWKFHFRIFVEAMLGDPHHLINTRGFVHGKSAPRRWQVAGVCHGGSIPQTNTLPGAILFRGPNFIFS